MSKSKATKGALKVALEKTRRELVGLADNDNDALGVTLTSAAKVIKDVLSVFEDVQETLFPDGDVDAEWDSETVDHVVAALHDCLDIPAE